LPEATLAAVVIAAVLDLIHIPALRRLYGLWTSRLGTIYGPAARSGTYCAALGADTLLTKIYRSVDAAVDAVHTEEPH
jgi:hypothetical protein